MENDHSTMTQAIPTLSKHPDRVRVLVWIVLGVATAIFFMIFGDLAQDDAFITFRYARNLAQGRGFVYNQNEWTLGTTTPLYTMLLATVSYLFKAEIVLVNKIISAISLWISAGLLYEIKPSSNGSRSFLLALIYLTNPFLLNFIGMESYFLLCFIMLTVWSYHKGKVNLSSICGGLLILIRYEMIFLSITIGVWDYYMKNRKPPYWLFLGFIFVFIWLVYATLVFGSPIPLSASAKLLAPRISFMLGGAVYWYRFISENPAMFLAIILAITGILTVLFFKNSCRDYRLIFLFSVVYFVVASIFAGSFPWYYAPLIPGFSVAVIYGIKFLSHIFTIHKKLSIDNQKWWADVIQSAIAILLVVIQLSFWLNENKLNQNQIGDSRYSTYKQVSDWLIENASKEESLAIYEIGYVGYFTDMRIIDLAGLVTPGLLPWVDQGSEASLYHALQIYSPDFVLIPAHTAQIQILKDAGNYQSVDITFSDYLLFEKITAS